MTATSALEKVEGLIEVATQRLVPQALQRLSVSEILGEHVIRKATSLGIPTKDDLGITVESEAAYNRLVKFLRLHEPTGHEKDVAHKHEVVRFLNLKQMLHECQQAKLPHIQSMCLEKVVQWFDDSSQFVGSKAGVVGSASTPVLPPRMSPRKATSSANKADGAMARSSSEDALATSSLDAMRKAEVAHKLEKYKMPDLRASHIRRVAQLRSRGVDVPEQELQLFEGAGPEVEADQADDILEPGDYESRDRRAQVKATFKSYEPETEAEFVMNQVWLERKREEDLEKNQHREVRGKLHTWSMNKSRDESEYLRKREAMQLAAGLDKLVDGQLETINQPRRQHLEKKKQEWQALQQGAPAPVADRPDQVSTKSNSGQELEDGGSTPARPSSVAVSSVKKKKGPSGGSGTPVGSGGMHFRNQLPPNYTPQSKRSNGTPTSFSSKDSGSTPSTPLSTTSSGKLLLLDEAAARAENRALGRARSSNSPFGSEESPAVHDEEDERIEGGFQSPSLRFSERIQESRPELKFQAFHATTHTNQGSLPLTRVASASALNRKLFPRGTIPPQAEPLDPEYRHLYSASMSRKPPLPTNILPDKPLVGQTRNAKSASTGNNQRESNRASSASAIKSSHATTALLSSGSSQLLSDFRAEQMQEVERIRILFEQHKLAIPTSVVERGLLLPEDRSTYECVHNLPLPGARLVSNPLLQVRVKAKITKKKKKKKGGKSGAKKTKGKNSAGDRSKSPTKKKKK